MTNPSFFKRIAVFGSTGQLGKALMAALGPKGVALTRRHADLSQPEGIYGALEQIKPDAVINAAAFTAVDKAEEQPALAELINAKAPEAMAQWCRMHRVPFIHYSTDYVFDGSGTAPHKEEEPANPLNVYGRTKLQGERLVAAEGGQYLIFRTSWVYDATGKNFLNTMLRIGKEEKEVRVVDDQIGAPTYAPHLARATLHALETTHFNSGVYHLANSGETSWCDFAEAIFGVAQRKGEKLMIKRLVPIATHEYPTPAQRPKNSRLDCRKARLQFGITMPSWQEGLNACMDEKYAR